LLRFGAVVLVVGAVLVLCASLAAFLSVYNVLYSVNINGEVTEGSMEIDSDNNLERFKTGSAAEEAVEIHDFQIGIAGICVFGGDECYIKLQIKANLPHLEAQRKESRMFDLMDESMPLRFDEGFLRWVAGEQSLKDTSFLSNKVLGLCGELPIYWLHPTFTKEVMKRREAGGSRPQGLLTIPKNPYPREEGAMTFDPMLDHKGMCYSACQCGYAHFQTICDGDRSWPSDPTGCAVSCSVIIAGRWWVARIPGCLHSQATLLGTFCYYDVTPPSAFRNTNMIYGMNSTRCWKH
uniref:Leukocyte cell-derived chemotaxin 1 n=1 Tax=Cynoglossus semilaevis TaxID=244447 RepID=A0A3P8VLY8_CYNSE